jgi:8-oxo-dGTP pyrophosphatase MutT (NUDIX family)
MYKIYIGTKPIILADRKDWEVKKISVENALVVDYYGQKNYILRYVDSLEKGSKKYDAVVIRTDNLEQLWNDFKEVYHIIEAAGGLVFNAEGKVLAIFRKGHWDLPKGKIDKGESPEEAAVREVQEETGLFQLSLGEKICDTYHTYADPYKNGRRVLKKSHWYRMQTIEEKLIPQTEEDIELATWLSIEEMREKKPIFENILEVLNHAT